jgi:hypothetical protein
MADNNTTPTNAEGLFIPRATFGADEFSEITEVLRSSGPVVPQLAEMMANTLGRDPRLQNRGDNYLNYNALRMGNAGILRDLGIEPGKSVTDEQIIELFGRDTQGRPISAGTDFWDDFISGAKREVAPAAVGAGGFYAGMLYGNSLVAAVPPVTPWTAAVRIGVPLLTGLGASMFGDYATRVAQDALIGEEELYVPGTRAAYEAGKATAGGLAFLPMPFLISGKVNLGSRLVLDNIEAGAKVPLPTRFIRQVENSLERTGSASRDQVGRTLTAEGLAVAGGAFGAGGAEKLAPDDPWVRFGFETAGAVSGGLIGDLAAKRIPQLTGMAWEKALQLFDRTKADSAVNATGRLTEAQQIEGGTWIYDQLRANKEDPEKIIELLLTPEFQDQLRDADGNLIQLDSATLTSSPTLLRMIMDRGGDTGVSATGQNKTEQATEALRRLILFTYAKGDREALGQMSELYTGLWDADITQQLDQATQRLRSAMSRVGEAGGESVDNLEEARRLYEVISNLQQRLRGQERTLWRRVPRNVELTTFNVPDGQGGFTESNTPNFITAWRDLTDLDENARNVLLRNADLAEMDAYVNRVSTDLGINPNTPAPRQLREVGAFNTARNKLEGTPFGITFDDIVKQTEGLPEAEQIAALRREADGMTAGGARLDQRQRDYVAALNARANMIIAQAQQTAMDGTPAPSGGVSIRSLIDMRSVALDAGRALAADGFSSRARVAYEFADAILKDLESFPAGSVSAEYDNARAFSRAYNDVFTRAFAGDVLGTSRDGAPRIPVEVLRDRLFRGDAGYLRAQQLDLISQTQFGTSLTNMLQGDAREAGQALLTSAQEAGVIDPRTQMLDRRAFNSWFTANENAIDAIPGLRTQLTDMYNDNATIRGASENLLRSLRSEVLNPDGTLSTSALETWMRKDQNQRLLESMPALRADLENIPIARHLLENTKRETTELAASRRDGELSLYELLPDKTQNPTTQVSLALSLDNPRPFNELNRLWEYIENVGEGGFTVTQGPNRGKTYSREDLVNGFRMAIMESVFNRQGENGPIFNVGGAFNTLFEAHPNSSANLRLSEWMQEKGIMSSEEIGRTRQLLRRMAEIQAFAARGRAGDTEGYIQQVGPLFALVTRISGSEMGAGVQSVMSGSNQSLIARQAGSQYAQTIVNKYLAELPASLRMDVIEALINDPQLLATALKKVHDTKTQGASHLSPEGTRIMTRLVQGLVDNGLMSSIRRTAGPTERLGSEMIDQFGDYIRDSVSGEEEQTPSPPQNVPQSNQQGSLNPNVIPSPTPNNVGPAPSPINTAAAPKVASIQSSGPVDRTRFAALFPEDRDLMGIASLAGQG